MKTVRTSLLMVLAFTVATGLMFPLAITLLGRIAFPRQASGSLIVRNGAVVGSRHIGQQFAARGYFHPRPSAAGNGYDATASGGTNLGPTSQKLLQGIHKKTAPGKDDPSNFDGIADLAKAYRQENGMAADAVVPGDAVTRSASGLDPDISPDNAALQAARVARARGISADSVMDMVRANTSQPTLGVLGEPRVNVLELNLELDRRAPLPRASK